MEVVVSTKDNAKIVEEDKKDNNQAALQVQLCDTLIYEILTRVELTSLVGQCQWVCRDWQRFMYETNFKSLHVQRTQAVSGYFFQGHNDEEDNCYHVFVSASPASPHISLEFLPKNVRIQASSRNGLLCCLEYPTSENSSYYVCKPVTREWIEIPRPRADYHMMRMEMVAVKGNCNLSLRYKIIRFAMESYDGSGYCEIFDSKAWAWKQLAGKLLDMSFLYWTCGIFANGAFHWLYVEDDHPEHIFVFHAYKEAWVNIAVPQIDMNDDFYIDKTLVGYEGSVGLVYSKDDWMEIWVLEDYDTKQTWQKKYVVDLECLKPDSLHLSCLLDMYSADIMLMIRDSDVILYNYKAESYLRIHNARQYADNSFFAFQSDLSLCNIC